MIPLSVSEKLLRLAHGEQLPASTLKHPVIEELINEDIICKRIAGRTKIILYIPDVAAFNTWMYNVHSINDIGEYIRVLKEETSSRAGLVEVSNNSKTKTKRTYKGFLVNSYIPVHSTLNGRSFVIDPTPGTFLFVHDFENFIPAPGIVVVGVENMENFRLIEKQAYLFETIKPLFVCRYPQEQSKDLIKWLRSISNPYLHFGDYDFAGINIFLSEYKKHLNDRATFFIPPGIKELITRYGNSKLYDRQQLVQADTIDENLQALVALLHQYKKGLEQEALLIS